jgi:hypothetical protein
MKALGGRGVQLFIHDLGTRWRWVVSITPRPRFTPRERTPPPGTHCTGGWVGPRAGVDTEARGKILWPCQGSNPDRPAVQPVVRHYTAWANPTPTGEGVSVVISPRLYVRSISALSVRSLTYELGGCHMHCPYSGSLYRSLLFLHGRSFKMESFLWSPEYCWADEGNGNYCMSDLGVSALHLGG